MDHEEFDNSITPEILEWARKNFDEAEFLAGIRQIRETGGWQLKDFIHELEEVVRPRE